MLTSKFPRKKKKRRKNWKWKAKCHLFQMQTSMFKTSFWIKWYYVETRTCCWKNAVTCFQSPKKWNYIWNKSSDVTLMADFFSLVVLRLVRTLMLSDTFWILHLQQNQTLCWSGWRAIGFNRQQTTGQHLQASLMWEALLTPITYSPALQGLIFITSIIFYHKYSNPDLKSRA